MEIIGSVSGGLNGIGEQWADLGVQAFWEKSQELERPHAQAQMEKELEKRRLDCIDAREELIIESELTAHGLLQSLIAKVTRRA